VLPINLDIYGVDRRNSGLIARNQILERVISRGVLLLKKPTLQIHVKPRREFLNLLFYDFGDSGHRRIGRKSSFYLANQGWEIVRCDVVGISKHGIQADTPHGDTVLNKNYCLGFSR